MNKFGLALLKCLPHPSDGTDESFSMNGHRLVLSGCETHPSITVPFNPVTNLLTKPTFTAPAANQLSTTSANPPGPNLTILSNINLTYQEKEMLRWHQRLGHVSTLRIQWMMRQGLLSNTKQTRRLHSAAAKLTHGPMTKLLCASQRYDRIRMRN